MTSFLIAIMIRLVGTALLAGILYVVTKGQGTWKVAAGITVGALAMIAVFDTLIGDGIRPDALNILATTVALVVPTFGLWIVEHRRKRKAAP
jgi:hypothetical protein